MIFSLVSILLLSLLLFVYSGHHHEDMQMDSSLPSPIDNLIILVGLPKSGTTSVYEALVKLGVKSNHHHVEKVMICVNSNHYHYCHHHYHQDSQGRTLCDRIFPIPAVRVSGAGNRTEPMIWPRIKYQSHKCYSGELVQFAIGTNQKPLKYLTDLGYQVLIRVLILVLTLILQLLL